MQNKKKNTKPKKKGVSLIVLVITIIVMVILAAAVIVSLNNTSILDKAQEAVDKTNAQEQQTASIIESLWNLITGGSTTPVTPPSTPQEDEIDTDNWEYAWTYTVTNGVGVWSDTLVKENGDEIPEGVNIVAKLCSNNKVNTSLIIEEGTEFEEIILGGKAYSLVIDGSGSMGTLIEFDASNNAAVYGWLKLGAEFFTEEEEVENGINIFRNITDIIIADGITNISDYAFYLMYRVQNVTIPSSVTSIGEWAFGSNNLTNVTIPYGVTNIGYAAFGYVSTLENINIPDSVTNVDFHAFLACTSLTNVTLSKNMTSISGLFMECTSLTNIIIPDNITSIDGAFLGCTNLISITFPKELENMGDYTFKGCTGLTSITIPNSVTSIGEYAFDGCTSLTNITIPSNVTSIGEGAFQNCTGLTNITINNNVIGESMFKSAEGYEFENPTTVVITATNADSLIVGEFAFNSLQTGSVIIVENNDIKTKIENSNCINSSNTTVRVKD